MKTNATMDDLWVALARVNEKYSGNIEFNRLEQKGKRVFFTLKVKDSKQPGHRRSFRGRRMPCACWHVHGHFFEELFKIDESIWIHTNGRYINIDGGNWVDRNIGSLVNPLMFSDACDCMKL